MARGRPLSPVLPSPPALPTCPSAPRLPNSPASPSLSLPSSQLPRGAPHAPVASHPTLSSSGERGGIVCCWGLWTQRLWRTRHSAGHHGTVPVGRHLLWLKSTRQTRFVPLGGRRPASPTTGHARVVPFGRPPRFAGRSSSAVADEHKTQPRRARRRTPAGVDDHRARPIRAPRRTPAGVKDHRARPRRAHRSNTTSSPSADIDSSRRSCHTTASCKSPRSVFFFFFFFVVRVVLSLFL